MPRPWWCASDVCLPVAYIGPKSRIDRPRKTKIGTEVAHVTRYSDTTFNVKRSISTYSGRGHVAASRTRFIQNAIETLQCDRQPLKKQQTFPVIAGGWTDSATQIQKQVQRWLVESPTTQSLIAWKRRTHGSEHIFQLFGFIPTQLKSRHAHVFPEH